MKGKFASALSLAMILAMLFTSVGLADYVVNNIDNTIDGTIETRTIPTGGSTAVGFFIQPNNSDPNDINGCNATGSDKATVNLNVPANVTASATSLVFDGCSVTQNVNFSSSIPGTYNINIASVTGGKPGSAWSLGEASFSLIVNGPVIQNQTITVTTPAPASAAYGSTFNVAATATSGLPVAITSGGSCTGSGSGSASITMTSGIGTCTVYYDQAGNVSWNPAPQKTNTTTAQKADATVIVTGFAGPYDGLPHGATGSATGVGGADLSAFLSLGATYTNVPGGSANWSFAGGDNYLDESGSVSIQITQVSSSTVVTFEPGPYVYRGTAYTATASVTGVNLSQSLGVTYSGDCTNVTTTNGCSATASFPGDTNHTSSTDTKSITISKAPVTATAGNGSGTYNGLAQSPTACEVSGTFTDDLNCTNDPASVGPNAGVYPIAPVVAGTGLGNFEITSVPGSYEILKADADCDVDGFTGTYDGQPHGATGTCTGVNGEDLSAGLNLGTSYTAYPGGPVHWTFSGGTNYKDQEGDVNITINKAPVTATAGNGSNTYDGVAHSPSACAVSGAYTGDLTCANNPSSVGPNAGTYPIVPVVSGTGLGNFEITSVPGSYEINKADATINISGYTGYYDGASHCATGTASGVLGENLSASLNLGSCFTNVPGGTANWTFTGGTNYNDASGSVAIVINAWTLRGFYQPVDMGNIFNTVKNGSTVPLKFEIFAGNTELTLTSYVKSLTYTATSCSSLPTDDIELTATGQTVLRYDTTSGQFIFNWQTPKVAGACYKVTMMTQDGSTLTASFKLK